MNANRKKILTLQDEVVRDLVRRVAQAPKSALLLDYDGTLAPLQRERNQAVPHAGVMPVLQSLVEHSRTQVSIVSGRRARDVAKFFDLAPQPEIWGSFGIERLRADGVLEMITLGERTRRALAEAECWLRHQALEAHGERKPGGVAVHWRGLPENVQHEIRTRVLLGWFSVAHHHSMELLEFDGGVEIREPAFNKGDAVCAVIRELDADVPVAYLGDDISDEVAFRALGSRGLSILVRPSYRTTAAQVWLQPPGELLDFLNQWLDASRNTRAHFAAPAD